MLAVVGMSVIWRARGAMPQFFVEKDSECLSSIPFLFLVSFICIFLYGEVDGECLSLSMLFCVSVAGRERVIPFKKVLRGRFQGIC